MYYMFYPIPKYSPVNSYKILVLLNRLINPINPLDYIYIWSGYIEVWL